MLRHKLGDETFWKGIRTYYKKYQNSNAMTADFQKVIEEVSGENLNDFFQQWIFTKGYPEIKWSWKYTKGKVIISIEQVQKHHVFNFPLEIEIKTSEKSAISTVQLSTKKKSFEIEVNSEPTTVHLDPNAWLLFEEK